VSVACEPSSTGVGAIDMTTLYIHDSGLAFSSDSDLEVGVP
jgi:hypothetical protein